jgi:YkoY family integral membrane protein
MFGQTFEAQDLAIIGLLIVMEGVLSIDNALVLGILAKRVPKHLQRRALTYGLIGAFVFRVLAIALTAWLIQIRWIKLLGGLYLVYVAVKHFFFEHKETTHQDIVVGPDGRPTQVDHSTGQPLGPQAEQTELQGRAPVSPALGPIAVEAGTVGAASMAVAGSAAGFWSTVAVIELTDIAFAVDSIMAAVGMVSGSSKTWVVITGGLIGLVLMRFAAVMFIKLLDRFPRFEITAYLLVLWIGLKLVADYFFNSVAHPHTLNFHSPTSPWAWLFWGGMLVCFAYGFVGGKKPEPSSSPAA